MWHYNCSSFILVSAAWFTACCSWESEIISVETVECGLVTTVAEVTSCWAVKTAQSLLFAAWLPAQLLHFTTVWGQNSPTVSQILQVCSLVGWFCAQNWHITKFLQELVVWSNF